MSEPCLQFPCRCGRRCDYSASQSYEAREDSLHEQAIEFRKQDEEWQQEKETENGPVPAPPNPEALLRKLLSQFFYHDVSGPGPGLQFGYREGHTIGDYDPELEKALLPYFWEAP